MNNTTITDDKSIYWKEKPIWCQPWSIILTGITILITSWIIFKSVLISSVILLFVLLWWALFLLVAPSTYS